MKNVGLVSLSAYLPGTPISKELKDKLVAFLHGTKIPKDYITDIEQNSALPGYIEDNYMGWESKPWYNAWLKSLPNKKQGDPFQGSKERRRVPMDPISIKESVVPHPMKPSDAEVIAGSLALVKWGKPKEEIDLVLTHSQVQDFPLPTNTSLVQDKLGLVNAGAYSVDSCCSSFVTLVEVATALVKSGIKKNVLIVNSILDSHINDKTDYYSVNTGDAATSAVVSAVEEGCGYFGSESSSHGALHDGIVFHRRQPSLFKGMSAGPSHQQDFVTFYNPESTRAIGATALENLKDVVDKLYAKGEIKQNNTNFLITHQPVAWAPNYWREGLGFSSDQFYSSFEKYGNVATCCVPVNLMEAIENDLIKDKDMVLLASSGAGENHIALLQKVSPELIKNVKKYSLNNINKLEFQLN